MELIEHCAAGRGPIIPPSSALSAGTTSSFQRPQAALLDSAVFRRTDFLPLAVELDSCARGGLYIESETKYVYKGTAIYGSNTTEVIQDGDR